MTDNNATTNAEEINQTQAASRLIPNLLDDVSFHCLARIPRSFHLNISLVSKSWQSAVTSTTLFTTRSLLNTTETSLYLNLQMDSGLQCYRLFTNCSPSPKKPSKPYLVPLPPIPCQGPTPGMAFAVVGPKIYVIGGLYEKCSNCMWVFDCRFSRWVRGPNMLVGREFATAGVVGGKIYVMGGVAVDNRSRFLNWAEVFDPVTESWAPVPCPIEGRDGWMLDSAVIGDRMYVRCDRDGVVYDVGADRWENMLKSLVYGWIPQAVVLGEVLYCPDGFGNIRGYDVKDDSWKELKGIEIVLPSIVLGASTMVGVDGRLCVVWKALPGGEKDVEIMCAEIEVWKEGDGSLNGKILWSDVILVAPKNSSIVNCMAAEF